MARRKQTQDSFYGILFFGLLLLSFLVMQTATTPPALAVRGTTAAVFKALLTPFSFIPRSFRLEQTNVALEQELMRLNLELARNDHYRRENQRLHELLQLPQHPDFELIPATVLAREQAGFTHRLLLNRGSTSGLQSHDPVVCPRGLVGKVVEVTPTTSQVILLNDPSFRARVRLQSNQVEGMLAYNYDRDVYLMNNVPLSAEITLGDTVVTAGLESLFPPAVPVGVVTAYETTAGLFWEVTLQPLAQLAALSTVGVLHRSGVDELD